MVALNLFGKAKLQKLMKKSLSIIQTHKIYILIPGLILETVLDSKTFTKIQYSG